MRVLVYQVDTRPKLDYLQLSKQVNRKVAVEMGFEYIFELFSMDKDFPQVKSPLYAKLFLVQRILDSPYRPDFVVFLDSDAWIQEPYALKHIIDEMAGDPAKLGAFSRDPYTPCGHNTYINSGSFIIRFLIINFMFNF